MVGRAENKARMDAALAKIGYVRETPTWGERGRLLVDGVGRRIGPIGRDLYNMTLGGLDRDLGDSARGKIMGAPSIPAPFSPNEIVVTGQRPNLATRARVFGEDFQAGADRLAQGVRMIPKLAQTYAPVAERAAPFVPAAIDNVKLQVAKAATYQPAFDAYESFQAGDEAYRMGDEQSAADQYANASGQGLLFAANVLDGVAGFASLALAPKTAFGASSRLRVADELPPLAMPAEFSPTPPRTDVSMSAPSMSLDFMAPAATGAAVGAAALGAPEARGQEPQSAEDLGYEIVVRPDADYSNGVWQRQRMQRVPLPDGSEGVIVPWRVKETGEERYVLRALEYGVPADILGEVKSSGGGPIRPKWPDDGEASIGENYPTGRAPAYDLIPLRKEPDSGNQGAGTGFLVGALARAATMRGLRGAEGVNVGGLIIGPTLGALAGGGQQLAQEADTVDVLKGTFGGALGGSFGSMGADAARVGARDVVGPGLRYLGGQLDDAIRYKNLFPQRRGPERGMFEGASQTDVRDALFQFEDARNAASLPSNPQAIYRDAKSIPPLFPDTSVPPPYDLDKWPQWRTGGAGPDGGGAPGTGGGPGPGTGGNAPQRTPRGPRPAMDPEVLARMQKAAATGLKSKKIGDLRQAGDVLGVPGASGMSKDQLVTEIARRMAQDGQRTNRLLRDAGIAFGLGGAIAIPSLAPPEREAAAPF